MVYRRRPRQDVGTPGQPGAALLRGKHKPTYTPHVDSGDYVIVINAKDVRLTGKKMDQKIYYRHSRIPVGSRRAPRPRCSRPSRKGWSSLLSGGCSLTTGWAVGRFVS